ncbi:conserved hypothetical protein [Bathymodiolus platifrons methanotrophic gill symbiont]|uniref:pentapeptide repeat-containing protein n=1 Tax=Bathymodiolus platifrons methanotrophic gill symbiont TaxID=113268 RepID=UPI000B416085|nr:pentapeptide repeat-containing protein [Bathymodiolus platifrons methanotrophic gill symbiont]GAW85494.1 conserved hypothetical protein [Bathymodiolus platifrons methanotrophic gill symbiont]
MNTNYKDKKTISGNDNEALDEFLAGKERWNAYVEKHGDDTEVDFSGVDFPEYRKYGDKFNFSGYRFPKKGHVIFEEANFGGVVVYFDNAKFGEGNVNFDKVKFKSFVRFKYTEFGKGVVSFHEAIFCKNVNFDFAKFGEGDVYFLGTEFRESLFFMMADFGEGGVYFTEAKFRGAGVHFNGTKFGQGRLFFKEAEFENSDMMFEYCEFKGDVSFRSLKGSDKLNGLSFRNSIFNKSLDISDNSFNCIPNLSNTKLTNQVSLDRMKVNHPNTYKKGDGESLCRLKEIAEDNKSYQQALDIHVMEMRAKRCECESKPSRILDCFFDKLCVYGQSISRPTICLLVSIAVSWGFYGYCSNLNMENSFLYSLSQALPFVSAGRTSENYNFNKLFTCGTVQEWMYFFSLIQGLFSFVFLFLIGLGLRNRFRL